MKFGSKFGSGFGSPENRLARLEVAASGPVLNVLVQTRADCGDAWFNLDVNSRLARYEYLKAGEVRTFSVPKIAGTGSRHVVTCICSGHAPESVQRSARYYDALTSRRVTHVWPWVPTVVGSEDTVGHTEFSGWTLSGITTKNAVPVTGQPSHRTLTASLTVSGESCTVTLRAGTVVLASGTGIRGAVLALSGTIAGSVTVASDAITCTEILHITYPASMKVKRGTVNPPTSVVASVPFNGEDETAWTEPADLTPATSYFYTFTPVSETGQDGTESSVVTVTLAGAPEPPTGLEYLSGDASSCTLRFTPSTTQGVTYRVYRQNASDDVMPTDPAEATITPVGEYVHATIATDYPGTAYVIVRAVKNGTEDRNAEVLALEFNAGGERIAPRPNAPTIRQVDVTDGRTVKVTAAYPVTGEKGTATHIHLYVDSTREAESSSSSSGGEWTCQPDALDTLGSEWNGVREATPTITLGSNGFHTVRIYAATAEGVESVGYAEERIYVSNAQPAAVLPDGWTSRG